LLIVAISCCEKTLGVMRASHDAILTIVQVLLYDPLYVWTISLVRGYQLQHRRAADLTDTNMNTSVDLLDEHKRQFLLLALHFFSASGCHRQKH